MLFRFIFICKDSIGIIIHGNPKGDTLDFKPENSVNNVETWFAKC